MKNPQIFNQFQEIRKTNNNPEELLKQITGKYTPEQMQNFMKFANNMGITTEQLNQFGINVK